MHPSQISIFDFSYNLPQDRIATHPLPQRDQSKLLVYNNGIIRDESFSQLDHQLPSNSLLVFNNTKVIEARLLFTKSSGSPIEIFCLEPIDGNVEVTLAMQQTSPVIWKCFVGGAKKWKGEELQLFLPYGDSLITLSATKLEPIQDGHSIQLSWTHPQLCFAEILHLFGNVPLPPYLNRKVEEKDKQSYQTIYAQTDGSVAAPTAGLHFTEKVFFQLAQRQIQYDYITLHVGAGTFKPVKATQMKDHEMHAEWIDVSLTFLETLISKLNDKVIAVGTTSMRTLESLYWIGFKILQNPKILHDEIVIDQWIPYYNLSNSYSTLDALNALRDWMIQRNLKNLVTKTQIIIAPGYSFKVVDGLITNFHQPQSTLLLLVSAFVGIEWKTIYKHALKGNYRFLSYGDSSLLWNKT